MHIAALAVALGAREQIGGVEANNYAVLPDTVFVRAPGVGVCRTPLKIDAAPILSLLPQSQSPGCLWTAPASMRL